MLRKPKLKQVFKWSVCGSNESGTYSIKNYYNYKRGLICFIFWGPLGLLAGRSGRRKVTYCRRCGSSPGLPSKYLK